MGLFAERKRIRQIEEREAAGESFWTVEVSERARRQVAHLYRHTCDWTEKSRFNLAAQASQMYCASLGIRSAYIQPDDLAGIEDSDYFLSFVEAIHKVLRQSNAARGHAEPFAEMVNHILNSNRVAYKFVNQSSQFVELESLELHVEVVEPAIRLVYGDPRLEADQIAYMNALRQISQGDAPNAITDAGTALQESLKALGAEGKVLGDQLKDARKRDLLPGRDSPLLGSVLKAMEWVASERNQNGDGHNVTDATLDDAWLIVHVVGALIVRLAGSPRS